MRGRRGTVALAAFLGALTADHGAGALDKQGSAHGGAVSSEEPDAGFDVSGALTLGVSVVNNSYAARPDNTGLVLMRYAGHADVDLIGRARSIPIDVNVFTDKTQRGLVVFAPTELDLITGVTTTRSLHAGGDLEGPAWSTIARSTGAASPKATLTCARGTSTRLRKSGRGSRVG